MPEGTQIRQLTIEMLPPNLIQIIQAIGCEAYVFQARSVITANEARVIALDLLRRADEIDPQSHCTSDLHYVCNAQQLAETLGAESDVTPGMIGDMVETLDLINRIRSESVLGPMIGIYPEEQEMKQTILIDHGGGVTSRYGGICLLDCLRAARAEQLGK